MKVLYNISMAKSKISPKSPFSAFSKFGGQPSRLGGPKFNPKTFNARPTFVTQHKGGGGGK